MKYKIGTMVELSAAGRKRRQNPQRVFTGFGIITNHFNGRSYPYQIRWFSETSNGQNFDAKEYELKKVRIPKSNKKKKMIDKSKRIG